MTLTPARLVALILLIVVLFLLIERGELVIPAVLRAF